MEFILIIDFIISMLISMCFNFPLAHSDGAVSLVKQNGKVAILDIVDDRIVRNYIYTGSFPETQIYNEFNDSLKNNLLISEVDVEGIFYERLSSNSFALWIVDSNNKPIYSKNSNRVFSGVEAEIF